MENLDLLQINNHQRIAFHSPCTLQHGQQLNGFVENILQGVGYTLADVADSHLCCGSAGTYSILQVEISTKLLTRKLEALTIDQPDIIVTANIGCQLHLSSKSDHQVQHWIALLDLD